MHRTTTLVPRVIAGSGAIMQLPSLIQQVAPDAGLVVCLIDEFFRLDSRLEKHLSAIEEPVELLWVSSATEPTTQGLDNLTQIVKKIGTDGADLSSAVLVGLGGGSVLDTTKALSVLMTNDLLASELQGWDLPTSRGLRKIGVPTLSGTGAEASRTAVLTNETSGLKLGINSDYSVFDAVVLDPDLTSTVPKSLYFFNGMDSYMHAFEILNGRYRNALSDFLAATAKDQCESVFSSKEPQGDDCRLELMKASFFGGAALTSGYVGAVHPISAALSVGYRLPHGLANVITLMGLGDYYPSERAFVEEAASRFEIEVPRLSSMTGSMTPAELYELTTRHVIPLENQFGPEWHQELTLDKFQELLARMG